jgi:hypothetical protein
LSSVESSVRGLGQYVEDADASLSLPAGHQ